MSEETEEARIQNISFTPLLPNGDVVVGRESAAASRIFLRQPGFSRRLRNGSRLTASMSRLGPTEERSVNNAGKSTTPATGAPEVACPGVPRPRHPREAERTRAATGRARWFS